MMSKVPEHLIEEARKRGIVPGAVIRDTWGTITDVPPTDLWDKGNTRAGGIPRISFNVSGNYYCVHSLASDEGTWAIVITPAPAKEEGGLKEGDACECGPAMRDAIAELAKELGIWHHNGVSQKEPSDTIGMWYVRGERMVFWVSRIWPETKVHTPEAFIAKMRITAKNPKPIMIGDHTVEFRSGSIEVGCTTVDNATVRAITEKLID